jgi:hypothetical protein
MASVNSGPDKESPYRIPLAYLKGAVSVSLILTIPCALQYTVLMFLMKVGHAKAKFVQHMINIRSFHTVISRGLIERHDCKR